MKYTILLAFFLTISLTSWQIKQTPLINLNTFKSVPKDMEGAGETFYLSAKDKKEQRFICTTDYQTALIYVNQKPIRFKLRGAVNSHNYKYEFIEDKYTLIIVEGPKKQIGDENYTMKGTIALICNSEIIWKKDVIGEGGD